MRFEFVSYDGKYPNLCNGTLVFKADGIEYTVKNPLVSGGICRESAFESADGPWEIYWGKLPIVVDDYYKINFEKMVNDNVEFGCCGGCS